LTDLLVDYCDQQAAATYAARRWHYTGKLPMDGHAKMVRFGAWEAGRFVGAVVFTPGLAANLHSRFDLDRTEVAELARVALDEHEHPTSTIVAAAVRLLRRANPGLRLLISFADPAAGHTGVLYQAMNWIYTGQSGGSSEVYYRGRWWSDRQLSDYGTGFNGAGRDAPSRLTPDEKATLPRRDRPGKHRYVLPLDRPVRRRVETLRVEYPR
jgi:hypothetical protein